MNQTRWVNTETVYELVDGEYVKISSKGYWYTGPMALCHDNPKTEQASYRFYDTSDVAIDAEDSDPTTLEVDTAYRFIVQIQNDNPSADEDSVTYEIQYNLNGAGWNNVTTTSSVLKSVAAGLTDTTATTSTLTGGLGTFIAGEDSTDGITAAMVITAGNHTEHRFGIQIVSGDVVNGDTVGIRATFNSYTALDTYLAPADGVASITVSEAVSGRLMGSLAGAGGLAGTGGLAGGGLG